jgi:hypothetical protein
MSDIVVRLRFWGDSYHLHKESADEIEKLRAALLLARVAVSHACELSDRILYTQDLVKIDAALGKKK